MVGIGTDVHAFDPGSPARGSPGYFWPGRVGLAGHSGGDVVAHAAPMLSSTPVGSGDLGGLVQDRPMRNTAPPRVPNTAAVAVRITQSGNFDLVNIGVQMIGNRPRIGPRRLEAQRCWGPRGGCSSRIGHDHRRTGSDGSGPKGCPQWPPPWYAQSIALCRDPAPL